MAATKLEELAAVDGEGLGRFEGHDGGAPAAALLEDGHLAHHVAPAENTDRGDIAERGGDADRHPPLVDQVQRVTGVAFVEEDLTAGEPPAAGGGEDPSTVIVRQGAQERPVGAHGESLVGSVSECHHRSAPAGGRGTDHGLGA